MRYEDASQTGSMTSDITARDDTDHLASNDFGPATGNIITGAGTVSGATGTDSGGNIIAIAGAGGADNSFDANGMLEVAGQYGTLTIDANGNYTYVRNPGSPDGVNDTFTYTLANEAGATDTAELVIVIGNPPILQAEGTQTIQTNDGVIVLPAGVELSDIRVVGRDLHITLPDGSVMVIPDGAVFVPQLVINGVEVPASNLAALLIDAEPRPAAGDGPATQPSSGGNFGLPPGPLDPGVPLGDLLPPTELTYTPPEVEELFDNLEDNDPPFIGSSSINVSDEGVSSVNAPLPDNAGSPDTTDLRINSGILPVSDPDGDPLTVTLGLPPSGLTSQGTLIVWSVSPDGQTLTGTAGPAGPIVITVHIDFIDAAGAHYTVTQSRPVDHPNTTIEDGVSFVIPVSVSDGENPVVVGGTITVTIEDDSPVVSSVTARGGVTLDETDAGTPAGFPISGTTDGPVIAAAVGAFGADGPAAANATVYGISLTGGVSSLASGLATAIGDHPITLVQIDSDTIEGQYTDGGTQVAFTIQMNGDGSVTLTQNVPLEHLTDGPPGPAHDDVLSLAGLVNATVTLTDRDGDTASGSAPIGDGLVFRDDGPDAALNTQSPLDTIVLDETRPLGTDTDDGSPVATPPSGLASGTLNFADNFLAPNFGADGPGSVTYQLILSANGIGSGLYALEAGDTTAGDGDGYGQGAEILLSQTGNTITGSAGGVDYFTISIDSNTGVVTFTQLNPIWHPVIGDFDDQVTLTTNLASDIQVQQTVTDSDGDTDTASVNIGHGVFSIQDDGPDAYDPCPDDVISVNDPDAEPFTGSLNLPDVGADQPGVVTFGVVTGDPVLDTGGNPVLSGDDPLVYVVNGNVLEARAGDTTGDLIFTITLNGDGTFTYDQIGIIGSGGTISFDNLTSTSAGNAEFRGVGANDPATTVDLLLSGEAGGADATVNTDSDSIGTANQSMDAGETVRIDFVSDLTSGAATPSGFGYTGHVSSSSFLGLIPQVQGNQDQTVAFTVWALDSNVTQATEPDRDPTGGFSDSTVTAITEVTVKDYLSGDTTTVAVSFTDGVTFVNVAYGISVRVNADGSVTFSGIQEGDSYGFSTGTGEFNAVAVAAEPAGTGGSTQDSFDLGVFAIGVANEFEPVDLEVPIILTDADGDAVSCEIDIHIGAPLVVADQTVTVNEAGLPVIGSDAASDSETQSGALTPTGGTGPYTFTLLSDPNGQFGNLVLNPDGTFTYTLDTPFDTQPDTNDGTNPEIGAESFDVLVTDSLGATHIATITVNIIDDVPSVDVTVSNEAGVLLTTQDADTIGAATDQDVTTADFSGAFGATTVPGADGQQSLVTTYSLAVTNSVSGLTSNGAAINLYDVGGVIVGSTAGAPPASLDDASIVFTISVSNTGVVTLRQMQQIDHTNADPSATGAPFDDHLIALANGKITLTRDTTITDNDGDVASDSAVIDLGGNIRFADHGPIANDDVDSVVGGFDPATGNVLTGVEVAVGEDANATDGVADVVGADGPGRITNIDHAASPAEAVPNGGSTDIQGTYGVLTIYSNGDYSYQRDPGTPGGVSDVFTYTLTDFDGDTATATLTISIDDNFPTLADPALVRLDDDALSGGNPGGPSGTDDVDSAGLPGQLSGVGGDGDLDYNFTGVNTLPTGFTTNLVNAGTLQILQGATVVLTITLDNETGAFNVVQNNPIMHPADNGGPEDNLENNLVFQIGVEVEDADGDTDPATITINVDDDTPTINVTKGDDSAVTLTTDDAQTIGGASDTAASTANFSGVFGLTQSVGADGGPAASLSFALGVPGAGANGVDSGLDQGGASIYLHLIGGTVVGSTSQTLAGVNAGNTVFDVTVSGTGVVTLTQYSQIDHPAGSDPTPGGAPYADHIVSMADGLITLTASATITDNDGDSASDSETVNIGANLRFTDDGPTAAVSSAGFSISHDETPGVQGDANDVVGPLTVFDAVASKGNDPDVPGTVIGFATSTGAITSTGTTFGADGGSATFSLNVSSAGVDSGLNVTGGQDILLYKEGALIVGRVSGGPFDGQAAFALSIDPSTGVVSMVQYLSIQHPNTGSNDESVSIANGAVLAVVTATDGDGDVSTASTGIGSLISFQDDGPQAIQPDAASLTNEAGASVTRDLDEDGAVVGDLLGDFGADGPGLVQFANITNGQNSGLTSNDDAITYWLSNNGQTLTAKINANPDGTGGTTIFTVQINQGAGDYTVTMFGTIDNGSGVSFDNLTSTKAGNVDVRGVGANDPATTVDLLLTASANGANSTINTDSDSIGSGNQSMDQGETVRIDFVTNLQVNAGLPSGFSYDGHAGTSSMIQAIPQVQGNQAQTVAFRVYALDTTVTDAAMPDDTPGDGFSDSSIVPITHVTVDGFDVGETPITVALGPVDTWTSVAYGVYARLESDGSVTFTGIQEGDQYGIETGSDFNAFAVTSLPAGVGPVGNLSTTNSFDLGVFAIGSVDLGDPVDISLDLSITDGDGDSVVMPGAIDITFEPAGAGMEALSTTTKGGPSVMESLSSSSLLVAETQEVERVAANSNSVTLAAAVAAAGMAASPAAAHDFAGGEFSAISNALVARLGMADAGFETAYSSPAFAAGNAWDGGFTASIQALSGSSHTAIAASNIGELAASLSLGSGPNALLEATDMSAMMQMPAPAVAMNVAMPSVESLMPQAAGVDANAKLGAIVQDALQGGGSGPDLDALLSALPGAGLGENAGLHGLATHHGDSVPAWDMGHGGVFTFDVANIITSEAMVLHHDAVQPVANG